jgi:hypothetical protein
VMEARLVVGQRMQVRGFSFSEREMNSKTTHGFK